ncbi:DNL zinc finger-domain-containing protein [Pyronema omphalodes]|nr:DNL zinc finger-domain-containing protein [Pyronema omphalodes]
MIRPAVRSLLRAARPLVRIPVVPRLAPIVPKTPRIASIQTRQNSTTASVPIAVGEQPEPEKPSYQLTFTCRPCQERSTHTITKQAYHKGSVLIECPGCKNRHVITDNLKIFGETARTLEEILAANGEALKRGRILWNGDIELLPPDEDAAEAAVKVTSEVAVKVAVKVETEGEKGTAAEEAK